MFAPLFAVWTATLPAAHPNVIVILTDDLGYGDLGCYGGHAGHTPNLDRLAAEGVRFTQFYVAAPICSPSRTALTTGAYPARWRITSYLHTRAGNRAHGQADFLDPAAPSLARAFRAAGYATGHFGKWHLGGGRDVDDAPLPSAYGFDEHFVNFEGLGPRIEGDGIRAPGKADGKELPRHRFTEFWVDKTIDFLRRHKDGPFFVNLWPMDVHDPHLPSSALEAKYAAAEGPPGLRKFAGVLDEYDRQMGRLFDAVRELGLDANTLILFTGDNGPNPSFEHRRTAGLRGQKWSLYEGGIREPFIVRWKGTVPAGRVDDTTVLAAVDLFPSLCHLAGVPSPAGAAFDGEDLSAALLGRPTVRMRPLFWEYGRNAQYLYPKAEADRSPNVAVRDGRWKLLVNADGSRPELYDLAADPKETANLAERQPDVARRLTDQALAWRKSLP